MHNTVHIRVANALGYIDHTWGNKPEKGVIENLVVTLEDNFYAPKPKKIDLKGRVNPMTELASFSLEN